jgi:hypothetical protein
MTMMKHKVFIGMRKLSLSEIASRVGLIDDIKKPLESIGDLQSVAQQLSLRWLHWPDRCVP